MSSNPCTYFLVVAFIKRRSHGAIRPTLKLTHSKRIPVKSLHPHPQNMFGVAKITNVEKAHPTPTNLRPSKFDFHMELQSETGTQNFFFFDLQTFLPFGFRAHRTLDEETKEFSCEVTVTDYLGKEDLFTVNVLPVTSDATGKDDDYLCSVDFSDWQEFSLQSDVFGVRLSINGSSMYDFPADPDLRPSEEALAFWEANQELLGREPIDTINFEDQISVDTYSAENLYKSLARRSSWLVKQLSGPLFDDKIKDIQRVLLQFSKLLEPIVFFRVNPLLETKEIVNSIEVAREFKVRHEQIRKAATDSALVTPELANIVGSDWGEMVQILEHEDWDLLMDALESLSVNQPKKSDALKQYQFSPEGFQLGKRLFQYALESLKRSDNVQPDDEVAFQCQNFKVWRNKSILTFASTKQESEKTILCLPNCGKLPT